MSRARGALAQVDFQHLQLHADLHIAAGTYARLLHTGFRTRALLVHQLFKKVISLSPTAWAQFSSGRVFNLVTSDVETLQQLSQNIMNLISSPLRIIVAMYLLYLQLGVASLVALASLILMMPIQVGVGLVCLGPNSRPRPLNGSSACTALAG